MRYAETLLADGEVIVLRARQHPLALLLDARYALLAWLIAIAAFVITVIVNPSDNNVRTLLGSVGLIALGVGLVLFFLKAWRWSAQDYLVTNRRILKVEGIFNKHSADSSLEKINDAVLDQNILGRILNYGDLDILTAAEEAVDRYRMLDRAPAFKREMLNQKHALEEEMSGRVPPPPLTAAVLASAAAPAPNPAPAVPPVAPPDPGAITRTLSELAALRDRGAISPEEYEAKKADLLGRL